VAYDPGIGDSELEGAWDFTLNCNIILNIPLAAARGPAPGQASVPSGAISFAAALEKQIGLKLEKEKRSERALVIDHMEDAPVEN